MNISKSRILGDMIFIREWSAPAATANGEAVILLHGIESHSEWFCEVAEKLADKGYAVIAYDRAGWGNSEGERGHIPTYRQILKQLTTIAASLRNRHRKVHLVGLSWGGMFALYATLRRRIFFDTMALIAPGIYPTTRFSLGKKLGIAAAICLDNRTRSFPLPINIGDFTLNPVKQDYIRNDPLRNTGITAATAFETLKMQRFCKETTSQRQLPTSTLLLAGKDHIINNAKTRRLLDKQPLSINEYPGLQHSLVFEDPEETAAALLRNFSAHTTAETARSRILIMGAGAVGSAVGGYLALGGNEVTLIGRKQHVEALNHSGLCLSLDGIERKGIRSGLRAVESTAELSGEFDLIIITVKSFDTETALQELAPLITAETTLMSLQNGIGNEPVIEKAYPENTILAGIICMNLNFSHPGYIEISDDKGGISIGLHSGSAAKAERAVKALRLSGLQVDYHRQEATRIKWSKMLLNISSNVLNAITGSSYKEILSDKFYGTLAVKAIKETLAVMKKEGIRPIALPGYNVAALATLCKAPDFIVRRIMARMADDSARTVTSMQQDLKKLQHALKDSGKTRPTEISELNGKIIELGKKHKIPTPANKRLCELLAANSN